MTSSPFERLPDPFNLDEKWLKKAQSELNEDPNTVRQNVQSFREKVQGECNLQSRTDDTFLLAFLRAKKHDQEAALRILKNYYHMKKSCPNYFKLSLPVENKEIYETECIRILNSKDHEGRAVIFFKADFDVHKVKPEQVIQLISYAMEYCMLDPIVQVNGITMVVDMTGQSFWHVRLMTPTFVRLIAKIFQDSYPIRLKQTLILNQPYTFLLIYSVMKPFLKEKLKSRIFILGANVKKLHSIINPAHLPVELGGKIIPESFEEYSNRLGIFDDVLRECQQFGYQEKASNE